MSVSFVSPFVLSVNYAPHLANLTLGHVLVPFMANGRTHLRRSGSLTMQRWPGGWGVWPGFATVLFRNRGGLEPRWHTKLWAKVLDLGCYMGGSCALGHLSGGSEFQLGKQMPAQIDDVSMTPWPLPSEPKTREFCSLSMGANWTGKLERWGVDVGGFWAPLGVCFLTRTDAGLFDGLSVPVLFCLSLSDLVSLFFSFLFPLCTLFLSSTIFASAAVCFVLRFFF